LKARSLQSETRRGNWIRGNWKAWVAALIFITGLCLIFYYLWGGRATSSDYEGKIVDRWADYSQSTQNSRAYFRLVIETGDGKRVTVKVDENVYQSARVGMRIKSRDGQVVLIEEKSVLRE
jgi:hypothetical protein